MHTFPMPQPPKVLPLRDIRYSQLEIPPYQRPYKWSATNVNCLISDLVAFRERSVYRLGTLVLNGSEIVDGQQRIITFALIFSRLQQRFEETCSRYSQFFDGLQKFLSETAMTVTEAMSNVIENVRVIDTRVDDLDERMLEFMLERCEFVVINLDDITEAFQFFDSQNARGKDLAPHDLLKAYHLREVSRMSTRNIANLNRWQEMPTDRLHHTFKTLFRAKEWSQGRGVWEFDKADTGAFKGVSVNGAGSYPFYGLEVIAHIFCEMYASDPVRQIDGGKLEYPFNLDDQIVNGSRFFDMTCHYADLLEQVEQGQLPLERDKMAGRIMATLNSYSGCTRIGDRYVQQLFYTTLVYYIDRFGKAELEKVIPKLFIWAFTLRLTKYSVRPETVCPHAVGPSSMLLLIHRASTPYDIINLPQMPVRDIACGRCEEIISLFKDLKKYHES